MVIIWLDGSNLWFKKLVCFVEMLDGEWVKKLEMEVEL